MRLLIIFVVDLSFIWSSVAFYINNNHYKLENAVLLEKFQIKFHDFINGNEKRFPTRFTVAFRYEQHDFTLSFSKNSLKHDSPIFTLNKNNVQKIQLKDQVIIPDSYTGTILSYFLT
jgi:hypothetical protein